MDFLFDPAIWFGFITLIFLEMVLGIDNLIFIVILSEKLPRYQRDKARYIGLIIALFMRCSLLSIISWITSFIHPLTINNFFVLSSRDIVLLIGGIFLFLKAFFELYEHLHGNLKPIKKQKKYSGFWSIVIQIIILDSIFSLDSIITATGIVNNLFIIMCAITISSLIMFFLSKFIIRIIKLHQNIIILCLSFLLIIGLNLIAESLGCYIPKGYIYAIFGFSICIEFFNQILQKNIMMRQSKKPIRTRILKTISELITYTEEKIINEKNILLEENKIEKIENEKFQSIEKYMLNNLLTLKERSIYSIMTPRNEISWININDCKEKIRMKLLDTPHNSFPICNNELDKIIGIIKAKELLEILDKNKDIFMFSAKIPPIIIPNTISPIQLLSILRRAQGNLVIVNNEFGIIQGLITPINILETIAGKFPDIDEQPDIIYKKDEWLVKGSADLNTLKDLFNIKKTMGYNSYTSLAGFLIYKKKGFPKAGEVLQIFPFEFHILEATKYQILLVRIKKIAFKK